MNFIFGQCFLKISIFHIQIILFVNNPCFFVQLTIWDFHFRVDRGNTRRFNLVCQNLVSSGKDLYNRFSVLWELECVKSAR